MDKITLLFTGFIVGVVCTVLLFLAIEPLKVKYKVHKTVGIEVGKRHNVYKRI